MRLFKKILIFVSILLSISLVCLAGYVPNSITSVNPNIPYGNGQGSLAVTINGTVTNIVIGTNVIVFAGNTNDPNNPPGMEFTGNSPLNVSGWLNIPSTVIPLYIVGAPNMLTNVNILITNQSFTLSKPINVVPGVLNYDWIIISNTAGTLSTISSQPEWKVLGTPNDTNLTSVFMWIPPYGSTNVTYTPNF